MSGLERRTRDRHVLQKNFCRGNQGEPAKGDICSEPGGQSLLDLSSGEVGLEKEPGSGENPEDEDNEKPCQQDPRSSARQGTEPANEPSCDSHRNRPGF